MKDGEIINEEPEEEPEQGTPLPSNLLRSKHHRKPGKLNFRMKFLPSDQRGRCLQNSPGDGRAS